MLPCLSGQSSLWLALNLLSLASLSYLVSWLVFHFGWHSIFSVRYLSAPQSQWPVFHCSWYSIFSALLLYARQSLTLNRQPFTLVGAQSSQSGLSLLFHLSDIFHFSWQLLFSVSPLFQIGVTAANLWL